MFFLFFKMFVMCWKNRYKYFCIFPVVENICLFSTLKMITSFCFSKLWLIFFCFFVRFCFTFCACFVTCLVDFAYSLTLSFLLCILYLFLFLLFYCFAIITYNDTCNVSTFFAIVSRFWLVTWCILHGDAWNKRQSLWIFCLCERERRLIVKRRQI